MENNHPTPNDNANADVATLPIHSSFAARAFASFQSRCAMSSFNHSDVSASFRIANKDLDSHHHRIAISSPEVSYSEHYHGIKECNPVWRQLLVKQLQLMGPIILTHFLDYLPCLVGIMLVAHLDSPDTELFVNAATMSMMFTTLSSLSVGYGLCSALDTLSSQAHGAGQHLKIGIYLQTTVIVVFGMCLAPVCLLNWHVESFLLLLGQDPRVARLAGEFSRYTVWSTPFLFFYEMMVKLLQAQNVVTPLVWIGVVGNLLEIVAGYVLCYHTTLGFHGAALARLLGSIVLGVVLATYVGVSGNYKRWWCGWHWQQAWLQVDVFLQLGIPGMLMLVMEWWAYEILTILAGLLPDSIVSVTAHVVLLNVVSLLYKVYQGVATSGKILVGNALGADMPKRAQLTSRITMVLVLTLSFVVACGIYALRFQIPTLFSNDPQVVQRAATALLVIVPYSAIDATYCAMQGIYCGMGRQQLAATTNAIAFYIVGLPIAALLAFQFRVGVEGLWIGFGVGSLLALAICSLVLYRTNWQTMADKARFRLA